MRDFPTEGSLAELKLQIQDLKKMDSLVLKVFVAWPSQTKSDRLPAKERAQQKARKIKENGHTGERLNEAWR